MKNILLFCPAVFLGAFLLFLVQPVIGKYLLPWFGGSPSVWTTCLLFFQLLLLGGYAYAHLLHRLATRKQVQIHVALLLAAIALGGWLYATWGSPILPSAALKPSAGAAPAWSLFKLLLAGIGLPYFLLSSSASLLQSWYYRMAPDRSAYVFYIVSNTASLLALLGYPFLVEPAFALKTQALLWSGGFMAYAVLCAACAVRLRHAPPPLQSATDEKAAAPGWRDYARWTVLAACGVLMLMSTTNQMTIDIPPVPFLWVLPLALYLLSYIVGFVDHLRNGQTAYILLLGLASGLAWYVMADGVDWPMWVQIAAHGTILFTVCLFCHNALYRTRPHPSQLTGFYLCLSAGGALGGLFVAVAAPLVFTHYWEYQVALVLAAVLAVLAVYRNPQSLLRRIRHVLWLLVAALAFAVSYGPATDARDALHRSRNFFGTLRVDQTDDVMGLVNTLYHGRISHGAQYPDPEWSSAPTTYYTESSGVGRAIDALRNGRAGTPLRVGMVGLGTGTLAAYGRAGDQFRFYDINPQVVALANDPAFFTYLRDSAATIETVLGDARLQLERELAQSGPNRFDLLVLDAFSGDSVPAHLLTKEAFALYLRHLAPDGLIAVHISNRYLSFMPLMRAVMDEFALHGVLIYNDDDTDMLADSTEWAILSPALANLAEELLENDTAHEYPGSIRIWTDDYSNLFSLFE